MKSNYQKHNCENYSKKRRERKKKQKRRDKRHGRELGGLLVGALAPPVVEQHVVLAAVPEGLAWPRARRPGAVATTMKPLSPAATTA